MFYLENVIPIRLHVIQSYLARRHVLNLQLTYEQQPNLRTEIGKSVYAGIIFQLCVHEKLKRFLKM